MRSPGVFRGQMVISQGQVLVPIMHGDDAQAEQRGSLMSVIRKAQCVVRYRAFEVRLGLVFNPQARVYSCPGVLRESQAIQPLVGTNRILRLAERVVAIR